MRLCKHLTCDRTATAWFRGPWCSLHILQFGDAPARHFAEGTNPVNEVAPPGAAPEPTPVMVSNPFPPLGSAPQLRTTDEFLDLMDAKGWELLDVEWMLVNALGEFE